MDATVKTSAALHRPAKIAAVVAAYWFVSISLVFLNKYLLSSADLQLNAPLAITWFQCLVSVVCAYGVCKFGSNVFSATAFPPLNFNLRKSGKVLPLSVVMVCMVGLNNLCLLYVPVSFYYIARSTTVVFNVIFTYFLLGQKSSLAVLCCCACIVCGFLIGVTDKLDGELSAFGVALGVLSTVFVALNAIYTKKMLPVVENSSWQLSLYNNFNSALIFLPLIILNGEHKSMIEFKYFASPTFWLLLLTSGLFGFLIGYFTVLQVKVTSPLTHNVSATAKSAFQTVLAVIVYAEKKDQMFWYGNAIVLVSSMAYSYVKHKEAERAIVKV